MRPAIHGWIIGAILCVAGGLAVCAILTHDGPPQEGARGAAQQATESRESSGPQQPLGTGAGQEDGFSSLPRRIQRVPDLLSPPADSDDQTSSPAPDPTASTGLPGDDEVVRADASVTPEDQELFTAQVSYLARPVPSQQDESPENQVPEHRPVEQFTRKPAQSTDATVPTAQEPVRPGQPPQSAQVPSFIGQVDVQGLDQLGVIILRGNPQDVENMKKIIEEIQKISEGIEPYIRVFQLQRASAVSVRETILELYSGTTSTTGGAPRTTTGQPTGQATGQAGQTSATALQTSALRRFQIAADDRSNTLVVLASPQMMEELSRLIARLDVDGAPTVNEIRVFQLKSAEATEVASVLIQAITGQSVSTTGQAAGGAAAPVAGGGQARISDRSAVVRFVPPDGQRSMVESGILDEVRVTAQVRTNSVIVSAPASSMPLLASIIAQLDKPPSIVAAVKVFELKNADATNMRLTIGELFDLEATTVTGGGGGLGGAGLGGALSTLFQRPIAVAAGDQPPVSIRVAVDERTNSLIVSGPEDLLISVEAVVRKLDLSDIHNRKSTVYRLKNSYAIDMATALTNFFTNKRNLESQAAGLTAAQGTIVGAYQRLEQDVVVVALDNSLAAQLTTAASVTTTATPATQGVSNTLLISASPRYYDQVIKMIEDLDAPQPQVLIQCIVAQLLLNDDCEFGIEFGLQSDVLFNRGGAPGAPPAPGTTVAPGTPGFNFNSTGPLGNTNAYRPAQVGNQGLSNFSIGRASLIDGAGGAGGLILAASSKNISSLIRALEINGRLEILTRPQIMTMDGRTARVQVGEQFPYVGEVNLTQTATVPTVNFLSIGIILTVKPSITPDNRIYLEVVPEISELRELVNVQTITTTTDTITIQAPRTTTTTANTAVSVNDGQTIVLGGLIQKRVFAFDRKIPWLGDLPHLGFLFRYSQERELKQELIIIMTPHIIRSEADAQRIKDMEVARCNWILNETGNMHGDLGLTPDFQGVPSETIIEELPVPEIEPGAVRTMGGELMVVPSDSQEAGAESLEGTPAETQPRADKSSEDNAANSRAGLPLVRPGTVRRPNLIGTLKGQGASH